ncbi:E3 ubiquitin-protein ligase RING1-like [Capsicum galapagoense]
MSAPGIPAPDCAAAATAALYFCHKCTHTVTITPSDTGDLICPDCNSDFVEEYEDPDPIPNLTRLPEPVASMLSNIFIGSDSGSGGGGGGARIPARETRIGSDDFDPVTFLQGHLAARRANGVTFEFIIDGGGNGAGGGMPLPANFGDYFVGSGMEELIQHLAENDPNRYGTPPASRAAVEGLPDVIVDEEMLSSELAQCAVCKDDFELGLVVKQMPCKHVYHKDCIVPWLELHNSCPVCRFELPTDDPDYENRERENDGDASGGGGSGSGRRFATVSLPWPFGMFGSASSSSQGGGSGSLGQRHRDSN